MTQSNSILVFDSGVGGLTIYQEIQALLPEWHYLYCSDNAFFPYSEKPEQAIIDRTLAICQRIMQTHSLKLIVIACNTASTVVLPTLRHAFPDVSIVGTVPAIKPAAKLSQTKQIGLLATKGTVKRPYTQQLIDQFALDCDVLRLGSTELVQLAEDKLHGKRVTQAQVQSAVRDWADKTQLDTVILGCTHFPFLRQELQQALPQVKHFIDSGKAIAARVQYLLKDQQPYSAGENCVYYTQVLGDEQPLRECLAQMGFKQLRHLPL
ncbi:glutamate racemase [Pasteurellaceae bacterium HPA106]|uniref:glutamate racemase n=1 Tax=Spirabiliibacterium pneumoniae TaxID=221400 RepID=UPI001AADF36D|nr:glutamate racemase [Spirabiliibacterium pneumoniae]MBE2896857.1 glutamate racemase [Spirabiliibacterium pneumoniae]